MRLCMMVLLVGCETVSPDSPGGKESALEGVYGVERYAENPSGCAEAGAVDLALPYAHLDVSTQGGGAMTAQGCDDPTGCETGLFATYNFDRYDNRQASGAVTTSSYSVGSCFMEWREAALSATDDGVRVVEEVYQVQDVPGADLTDCTEQLDAWTGSRDCVAVAILEAVAL